MSFNKIEFKEKLENKDYSYCIYILHIEIKNILIQQLKKINKDFKYINLSDLKNKYIEFCDYDSRTYCY